MRQGDVVGDRYTVGAVVGRGAIGVVHEARDETTGHGVLVTVPYARVRAAFDPDPETRVLDAQPWTTHPSVVALLAAGRTDDGVPWFATGAVIRRSLAVVLENGPLPERRALSLGTTVADALAAVHAGGGLHRALRPDAVAVPVVQHSALSAGPQLLDTGVADLFRLPPFTQYPRLFGTAAYVSPEQVWDAPVGPPADVYALGLVLAEALTGAPVFPGSTADDARLRVLGAAPIPDGLAPGIRALLVAMTDSEPADRPSAPEVAEALRAEFVRAPATASVPVVTAADRSGSSPASGTATGRPADSGGGPRVRLTPAIAGAMGVIGTGAAARGGVVVAHGLAVARRVASMGPAGRSTRQALTVREALAARLRGRPLPEHLGRRVALGGGGVVVAAGLVLLAAALPAGTPEEQPRAVAAVEADVQPPAVEREPRAPAAAQDVVEEVTRGAERNRASVGIAAVAAATALVPRPGGPGAGTPIAALEPAPPSPSPSPSPSPASPAATPTPSPAAPIPTPPATPEPTPTPDLSPSAPVGPGPTSTPTPPTPTPTGPAPTPTRPTLTEPAPTSTAAGPLSPAPTSPAPPAPLAGPAPLQLPLLATPPAAP